MEFLELIAKLLGGMKDIPLVLFSTFVICFIGYSIGAIKIKGLSLGTAGVFLFALLFGYLCTLPQLESIPLLKNFFITNTEVNKEAIYIAISSLGLEKAQVEAIPLLKDFLDAGFGDPKLEIFGALSDIGLVLFVTSVGCIAGPKFFRNLKVNAKSYVPMGIMIVIMGAAVTTAFALIPKIGAPYATGVLSGALTSTPAFSAAKNVVKELASEDLALVSLGHAVAYPFGVIGVVLFVQIMPRLLKADMNQERKLITMTTAATTEKKAKKLIELDEFGFGAFGLVILTGIILGSIKIPLTSKGFAGTTFSLGMTGGPLLMGLIWAHFGRLGPISLKVEENALKSFREFGLMLFLVGAGVEGGAELVAQIEASDLGGMLVVYGFIAGAIMTLIPMVVGFVFAKYVCKLPLLNNLGSITGGMTSTPALGSLIGVAGTDDVAAAYASTYPIALVLIVLASQLINTFMLA